MHYNNSTLKTAANTTTATGMPSTKNGLRIVFIFANFFNRNITLFLRGRVTNRVIVYQGQKVSHQSLLRACYHFVKKETLRTSAALNFTATAIILRLVPFKRRSHTKEVFSATTAPFPPPPIPPSIFFHNPSSTYSTCNSAGLLVASVFPLYFSLPCSQIPLHSNNQLASSPTRLLPRRRTRHRGTHFFAYGTHRRHPEQEADQGGGGKRCERREAAQRGRTGREENRKRRLPRQTQGRAHRRTADYLEPFLRAITRSSFVLNLG